MATQELQVNITIHSAKDLPKTDLLSAIDAYVVVTTPNKQKHTTKVVNNDPNPKWDNNFTIYLPFNVETGVCESLFFELYDKNVVSKNEKVATAELQLNTSHFVDSSSEIQVPLQAIKSKYSHHEMLLTVKIKEYALSSKSLYNQLKEYPQFKDIQHKPHTPDDWGVLFVPLEHFPGTVLGLEFQRDYINVKMFMTSNDDAKYVDIVIAGDGTSKVQRHKATKEFKAHHTLLVYEEICLYKVPFSVLKTPGMINLYLFEKAELTSTNLSNIIGATGWKGAMDFKDATKALKKVEFDHKTEEIYIPREYTFIVVDFEKDDVRIKCLVRDTPENAQIAYDLTINCPDVKKSSEIYIPSRMAFNGKYAIQRRIQLEDVPYGLPFTEMVFSSYRITNPMHLDLFNLIKIHPF